jgi:DNA (cytosine-5)-methyltransferase 1
MRIYKETVPPYKVHRYPNKFRKMWADQPARTVPAHIGKDSYSHIHFDSNQARGISLREAARLQSFPDAFQFHGSMNSQLTQIGNAVPPLMAFAVAKCLRADLVSAWQEISQSVYNCKNHKLLA